MHKVILFGTNNWSDMVLAYMRVDERYCVKAYTVDKKYFTEKERNGIPVVPF